MAYILKLSGYLVDPDCRMDEMSAEELNSKIRNALCSLDMIPKCIQVKEKVIGEWSDNHPLNSINCGIMCCEHYFKENMPVADILLEFASSLQCIRNECKGDIALADEKTNVLLKSVIEKLGVV